MSHQIAKGLYLGDEMSSRKGFDWVIDLREWTAEEDFEWKDYTKPYQAIKDIHTALECGNVLVFCHAGMDRSPFVVAMYLHHFHNKDPMEAYEAVRKRRPQTIIHDEWVTPFVEWLSRKKQSKRMD